MANITELLDKLKNARQTVELVDACCMRVCSTSAHFGCPYGDDGVKDCAERLQEAYEDTVENLLQLAEALLSGGAEDQGLVNTPRPAWIPVAERLPESGERVLAYCKDRVIHDVKWSWPNNEWLDKVTGNSYFESFVTHWMPLPEAPEVK